MPLLPGIPLLVYPHCRDGVGLAVSGVVVVVFGLVARLSLREARRLEERAEGVGKG